MVEQVIDARKLRAEKGSQGTAGFLEAGERLQVIVVNGKANEVGIDCFQRLL